MRTWLFGPSWAHPTAQMLLGPTPSIPIRTSPEFADVNGFGLGTMVQLTPSQCSIRVRWSVLSAFGSVLSPTTHAFVGLNATIPLNQDCLLAGLGTRTVRQLVPSQCAMSGDRVDPIW